MLDGDGQSLKPESLLTNIVTLSVNLLDNQVRFSVPYITGEVGAAITFETNLFHRQDAAMQKSRIYSVQFLKAIS